MTGGMNLGFDLSQIQQIFVTESNDLLVEMEEALLRLEDAPDDAEVINQLFRAAHTIKGSAGLFSLNEIVSFTHSVETVLNLVRDGDLVMDSNLVALMLLCRDHIQRLVEHIGTDVLPADIKATGNNLLGQLAVYDSSLAAHAPAAAKAAVAATEADATTEGPALPDQSWFISIRFGQDSLRNGMDPASTLLYLGTMGTIKTCLLVSDALPAFADMDPESCFLGFEIEFVAKDGVSKADINGAFDFVREDSLIHIFPPKSAILDVINAIKSMPSSSDQKIGEILVNTGILSRKELEVALGIQSRESMHDAATGKSEARAIGQILVEEGLAESEVVNAALEKQQAAAPEKAAGEKTQGSQSKAASGDNAFIRVEAAKLDSLINLVGELVIAGSSTDLFARRTADEQLIESTQTLLRLVEEIRDSALNMRMVQIGATFSRFQRVVRDISKTLGKDVDLVITGAEAELDKSVVEKLGDPLMHLVRNSMDHGIETPETRIARGKPGKAELRLNAYHDSGAIVIEVSDDGGGLNTEKILEKATARGLVAPNAQLGEKEINNLIFEPGFSTADKVTDISGRGVGMDVVRRNIESLRGSIEIESKRYEGTTIRIRLPLTLAIIDGFMVAVGKASYIIPLDMVVECVDFDSVATTSDSKGENAVASECGYINMRGEVLPFIRLRDHFGHVEERARRENIVVVQYGDQKAGLVVDELNGETQTVIKPLGKIFEKLRGIGGATILGSGEVALVLEVQGLLNRAIEDAARKTRNAKKAVA